MEEKVTISILTSELEKLGARMLEDLESFLVELDGNLKDIEPGILIKIPQGAGSVRFSISVIDYSMTLSVWMTETITPMKNPSI